MSTVRSQIVIECQLQIGAGRNECNICASFAPASDLEIISSFLLRTITVACVTHLRTKKMNEENPKFINKK